jgi:glucosamine-6-phosphate deaminase
MERSPRVVILADARAVARELARRVGETLRAKPDLVLGLPTGRTPLLLYQELVELHRRGEADFNRAITFNLDEFLGVAPEHPGSYRSYIRRFLFDHVNANPSRTNFLDGAAADPQEECERYEREIDRAGGIDLQILGIGTNGHIGFNEPAAELEARTHRVRLKPETRRSNAALFGGDAEKVPAEALSMGMGTILQARAAVLIATGRSKALCVERLVNGPITTLLPASFLQLHRNADIYLDDEAASALGGPR